MDGNVDPGMRPGKRTLTMGLPAPVQRRADPQAQAQADDAARPSARLPGAEVDGYLAGLDAAGFFTHPGYEANPKVEDGSCVIVRARRGNAVHTVVFENVRPDYVAELVALPLRVTP